MSDNDYIVETQLSGALIESYGAIKLILPVTEFYTLLYGTGSWVCPQCALKKAVEDARKRSNKWNIDADTARLLI